MFGPITLPYTADNVMDNMLSVLTNSPLGTGIAPDPGRISEEFPYFSRPVRA